MAHLIQRLDAVLSLSAGDRVEVQNFCWLETGDPNTLIFNQSSAKKSAFHEAIIFPITGKTSLN